MLHVTSAFTAAYLDRKREEIDLLERLDLHILDQATKLGDRNPLAKKSVEKGHRQPLATRDGPAQPPPAPATTYFLIFGLASASPAASSSAPTAAAPAAPQPGPEAAAETPSGRSRTSRSTGVVRHLLKQREGDVSRDTAATPAGTGYAAPMGADGAQAAPLARRHTARPARLRELSQWKASPPRRSLFILRRDLARAPPSRASPAR